MFHPRLQSGKHLGIGALLGGKNRDRPLRTREGVVHIAGDDDPRLKDPGIDAGRIDPLHHAERLSPRRHLPPVPIEDPHPQRLQESDPSVHRGTAAQSDHDFGRAVFQGVAQQLPRSPGGGPPGVPLSLRNERQSRCSRHLQHDPAVGKQTIGRLHRFPQGTRHPPKHLFPAAGPDQGIHRPLATVGQ